MRLIRLVWVMLLPLLFTSPAKADFGDCTRPDYVRSFDERLASGRCEELGTFQIRYAGGSIPVRVLRLAGSSHGSSTLMLRHVEALTARVGPAMDAIAGLKLMPVSVLLTDLEERRLDAHAIARHRAGEECVVTVYKQSLATSVEQFTFTYAHELFHCIQFKTWPSRYVSGALWWMEGTAEYFAQLVQPGTNNSAEFIDEFDAESNGKSILDMDYGNVVLFFWLAQNRGPGAIRSFIDAMPDVSARPAHLAALQRAVPRESWVTFGQEYFDGKVRKPGGTLIPKPRYADRTVMNISGSGTHTLPTPDAYVLTRRLVTFRKGRSYALAVTPPESHLQVRMSPGSESMWDNPPPRVSACSNDVIHRMIITSTQSAGSSQLNVTAAASVPEGACCMIGKWSPTDETLQEVVNQQNAYPGGGATCRHIGGTWILGFSDDGTGNIEWKDFTTECRSPGPGIVGVQQQNGSYDFRWAFRGDHSEVTYTSTSVRHRLKMSVAGREAVNNNDLIELPAEPMRTHGILHTCRTDSLQVRGLLTLPTTANHRRLVAPTSR